MGGYGRRLLKDFQENLTFQKLVTSKYRTVCTFAKVYVRTAAGAPDGRGQDGPQITPGNMEQAPVMPSPPALGSRSFVPDH